MKKILPAVLIVLALILPFAVTGIVTASSENLYDETFLAELRQKYDRLCEIDEPKLVLIGGSSLPFGIDSAMLEEYVNMPVVNFGLYASIGTKAMLDLSRGHIHRGDIVVICPETDSQTYSLYYGAESMWQALDGNLEMLSDVGFSNFGKLFAALPGFAAEKLDFIGRGEKPKPSGIYRLSSFDEYGDIAVERLYNEMRDYGEGSPITLSVDIIDSEFTDYLNDYAAAMKLKGANVYFSFSPMNEAAVTATDEEKTAFYRALGEALDFPIISGIDTFILDREFFYDTNFHLNTLGAKQRTVLLAADILREMAVTDDIAFVKYTPPTRPDDYFKVVSDEKDAEYAADFIFAEVTGGVKLVGLSEAGKKAEILTVPHAVDGKAVISMGSQALSGGIAKTIVIPSDSLKKLEAKAFAGIETLRRIEIDEAPDVLTADADTFGGMVNDCYVYVSGDLYGSYATDYFWSGLMAYVKRAD